MNVADGSGKSATTSDSDGEDQDEPSSSSGPSSSPTEKDHVETLLSNFREKWQKELQSPKRTYQIPISQCAEEQREDTFEDRAKKLFLKGVEMEKSGKLYEAIQFYRKAVQLVPDIEFKLDNNKKQAAKKEKTNEKADDQQDNVEQNNSEDEDSDSEDLVQRIQRKIDKESLVCVPKFEQKATHISALPTEMILYVLRWVVSAELDLRSLEMFSMTCRGFYLCARDLEIWRLACLRVWGLNCGSSPHNYLSWRHMFIDRNRLHFNGCYIGKTTYIRHGESSFQDQFYRPWHIITYYRYFRFFPEGIVLVLTSSDEPAQCVGQLKQKNARWSHILQGYYRLKDDKVTLVVQKESKKHSYQVKKNKRRGGGGDLHEVADQTFHMELQIKTINQRRHVQLVWTHYSVLTKNVKGDESTCNFDLVNNRFPPLWFSRVKSYTAETESLLQ